MSQVKGQEAYKGRICCFASCSCNQPSHLTSWGSIPLIVNSKELTKIATAVAPKMLPVTNRIALAGNIDCKMIAAKTPTVIKTTTTGKPTTKKHTVRVNVQSRKLLAIAKR